jgi:hypothetical protein
MRWYVFDEGSTSGPFEGEAVADMIRNGELDQDSQLREGDSGPWLPVSKTPFGPILARLEAEERMARDAVRSRSRNRQLMFWLAAAGLAGYFVVTRSPPQATAQPEPVTSAAVTKTPSVTEQLFALRNVEQAITLLRPRFTDTYGPLDEEGTQFSVWAADYLTLESLQAVDETRHAFVMKDSESERGRRICSSGTVVQISVSRDSGRSIATGLLITSGGDLLSFAAVGSTSDILPKSPARLCGVVIGKNDYPNSGGGTGHSVFVVGMFDLPQNKRATKR